MGDLADHGSQKVAFKPTLGAAMAEIHQFVRPQFYVDVNCTDANVARLSRCPTIHVNPTAKIEASASRSIHEGDAVAFFRARKAYKVVPNGLVDLAVIDATRDHAFLCTILSCIEKVSHIQTLCVILAKIPAKEDTSAHPINRVLAFAKLAQAQLTINRLDCEDGKLFTISGLNAALASSLNDACEAQVDRLIPFLDENTIGIQSRIDPYRSKHEFRKELRTLATRPPVQEFRDRPQAAEQVDRNPAAIPFVATIRSTKGLSEENAIPREAGHWVGKDMQPPALELRRYDDLLVAPSTGLNRAGFFDQWNELLAWSTVPRYGYGSRHDAPAVRSAPGTRLLAQGTFFDYGMVATVRDIAQTRTIDEALIFGYFDREFGHTLTESLSRTWPLTDARFQNMPVVVWGDRRGLKTYHEKALSLLGVEKERIIIADEPVVVAKGWIASRGYRLFGAASPKMAQVWGKMRDAALKEVDDTGIRKVFLSRGDNPRRILLNQEAVEEAFRTRGFEIVRPETIPFVSQIALVGRCEKVAGCFGSQMHLSMFLPEGAEKFVIASEKFAFPDEAMISMANSTKATFFFQGAEDDFDGDALNAPWSVSINPLIGALDEWLERN